ncbi:hypothetical protein EHS25_003981 [Saitozyma podzolica]|uniref:Uncharacterized protein n=1 Tax=Saitozyma podzolica TaxID=1890683 RepID=A0A427YSQ2_9TREE|nr:hypothetical protein EHS25_003981 [Saitozyma podzolica]
MLIPLSDLGDSGDGEMSQAAAAPIHLVLPRSELTAPLLSTPSLIHGYRVPVPSSSTRISPRPSAAALQSGPSPSPPSPARNSSPWGSCSQRPSHVLEGQTFRLDHEKIYDDDADNIPTHEGNGFKGRREAERIDAADGAGDASLQGQTFGAVLKSEDLSGIQGLQRRPTTAEEYHEESK